MLCQLSRITERNTKLKWIQRKGNVWGVVRAVCVGVVCCCRFSTSNERIDQLLWENVDLKLDKTRIDSSWWWRRRRHVRCLVTNLFWWWIIRRGFWFWWVECWVKQSMLGGWCVYRNINIHQRVIWGSLIRIRDSMMHHQRWHTKSVVFSHLLSNREPTSLSMSRLSKALVCSQRMDE